MRIQASIFALLGVLAWAPIAHADGGLEVDARLAPTPSTGQGDTPPKALTVGEPFTLIVTAKHAPGGVALLPSSPPWPAALAERVDARKHARQGDGQSETDRYELELIAFEAGTHVLPALSLALGSTTADTRPLTIEVVSGLGDDELMVATTTKPEAAGQALAELEQMAAADPDPVPVLVEDYTLLYVSGGFLLALLVLWLVLRWKKRIVERPEDEAPRAPPRPAHEVANERLAQLRHAGHLEDARFKVFHVELSEILREYLGARYGFDSLDLTVFELLDALAERPTPGLDRDVLRKLLNNSDLVKFAKFTPTVADSERDLALAIQIVHDTRPAPTVDDSEESAA